MNMNLLKTRPGAEIRTPDGTVIRPTRFAALEYGWYTPDGEQMRKSTTFYVVDKYKGAYDLYLDMENGAVYVGAVRQRAVGLYTLHFVSGSSYSDRMTLVHAMENVAYTYLNNAAYEYFKTTTKGLVEAAEKQAKADAQQAQIDAIKAADQVRKERLSSLGIESDGKSLTAEQIDSLLAIVAGA